MAAFDELLGRLKEAGVDFVLVGGLALNSWGVVRGTKDVDIVPDPDQANLSRLASLAVELGGRVHVGESLLGSEHSISAALAGGEQVALETALGRLDVVQGLDGVPAFRDLSARAGVVNVLGVEVLVCSREDLRAMKKASGRTRDLADLEDLEAAEGSD
jgi:hypothetical protein